MKSQWSSKAKRDLDRIAAHVETHFSHELAEKTANRIKETVFLLESFPELGRKIGGHFHKRYLIIEGNIVVYEIVLSRVPMVVIRAIKPRKLPV